MVYNLSKTNEQLETLNLWSAEENQYYKSMKCKDNRIVTSMHQDCPDNT